MSINIKPDENTTAEEVMRQLTKSRLSRTPVEPHVLLERRQGSPNWQPPWRPQN